MVNRKGQKRNFKELSYRQLQRHNSENRNKLKKEDQKWLRDNGFKNVGWENVINLYQKIEEFLNKYRFEDMSLEALFLEADRIGNKYLSPQEIEEFNRQLSKEITDIGALIDEQFPDTEIEVVDYSKKTAPKEQKRRNQKTYRTTKL